MQAAPLSPYFISFFSIDQVKAFSYETCDMTLVKVGNDARARCTAHFPSCLTLADAAPVVVLPLASAHRRLSKEHRGV